MSLSSSSFILNTLTSVLRRMLSAKSALFDVERNPLLKAVFKATFYSQFCAGETPAEVQRSIAQLHDVGYHGIILEYAKEVVQEDELESCTRSVVDEQEPIQAWKEGLIRTIEMVNKGDFVGMKWSGMGSGAFHNLKQGLPPSEAMLEAMIAVCDTATAKGVKLLPAAEPQYAQAEVDRWTCSLAAKYNRNSRGQAVIYNTYQCYLKSTAVTLSKHLAQAVEEGYVLGIKLVRGAYLGTEERHLIRDTKADTDEAYDAIAMDLLTTQYGNGLRPYNSEQAAFPHINVMLATHNMASVEKSRKLRDEQEQKHRDMVPLAYAQLQGMADELSAALLQTDESNPGAEVPQIYKCSSWGSTRDCLDYLLRRAAENRDAMTRTIETRKAMGQEMRKRVFGRLLAYSSR